MWIFITESIITGIITWIMGTILFNLSINKSNKDKQKPYGIELAFFMTGLIVYIIDEISFINKIFSK
jgi:hypothetical protein